MIDLTQLLKDTETRFRDRATIRADKKEKLAAKRPLQADTPERVEKRLERLGFDTPTAKALVGSDLPVIPSAAMIHEPELFDVKERIIEANDLMSISFLEQGTQAARSIGRIRVRLANGKSGFGTGFLVSPRLLLTNNHVLPNAQTAGLSRLDFDYQDDLNGNPKQPIVFEFDPSALFLTDVYLDYSLVAVKPTSSNGMALSSYGWHRLIETEGKVIIGESVSIIQHPDGDPKQVALRDNKLVDVLPDFLHYETDTAPGSSGSPVFNDQWEVVALHHSGVPQRDSSGRILNINGSPWKKEEGEQQIAWIANEGVRISRIISHIKGQTLNASAQELVHGLFNGTQPGLTEMSQKKPESNLPQPVTENLQLQATASNDGSITWTIPLQVSVRLGQPALVAPPITGDAPGMPSPSPQPALPEPVPVASIPVFETPTEADLKAALKDSKGTAKKPYYDEKRDREDREDYYESVLRQAESFSPTQFYQELKDLVIRTHKTKLGYKPSAHLYAWVDLHPDLKLRSIYSEQAFTAEELIRADFQVDQLRAVRSQELLLKESVLTEAQLLHELDLLEASLPYNCEHVVPQSWFGKKNPMRGDLHHLFACEPRCNTFRGNTPYYDFPDFGSAIQDQCGKLVGAKFEPNAGKGAVARATLYFLLRYPGEIDKTDREYQSDRLPILLDWHQTFPVTEYEKHRNAAIYAKQGNRNPLIDFPEWAEQIDFRLGLG
jgi:endonuclease I/V8-like Glu-specific endopeptidase